MLLTLRGRRYGPSTGQREGPIVGETLRSGRGKKTGGDTRVQWEKLRKEKVQSYNVQASPLQVTEDPFRARVTPRRTEESHEEQMKSGAKPDENYRRNGLEGEGRTGKFGYKRISWTVDDKTPLILGVQTWGPGTSSRQRHTSKRVVWQPETFFYQGRC